MKRVELRDHLETSIYKKLFYNGIDVFMLDDNSRLILKGETTLKLKPTTPYVVVKNSIEETFKVNL